MNEQPAVHNSTPNSGILVLSQVVLLVVLALAVLGLARQDHSATQLLPPLPEATSPGSELLEVKSVGFAELNADPAAFLNQGIQVTGTFLPLAPQSCAKYSGPQLHWALVAENLQLDAAGFERILSLLNPGTQMTVQGMWRLYQGPLGCGKGPLEGSKWYLQVERIVEPNPLISSGASGGLMIENADPGLPELMATVPPTTTAMPSPTPLSQEQNVPEATPTSSEVLPTPTAVGFETPVSDATPTLQPGLGTAVPTFPPGSVTITPTMTPTVAGTQPGADATATPSTPLPPTATETSGDGYPVQPTATTNPNPYP